MTWLYTGSYRVQYPAPRRRLDISPEGQHAIHPNSPSRRDFVECYSSCLRQRRAANSNTIANCHYGAHPCSYSDAGPHSNRHSRSSRSRSNTNEKPRAYGYTNAYS